MTIPAITAPPASITVRSTDTVDWLALHGVLDAAALDVLLLAFDRGVARGATTVVVNLADVGSLDVLGLVTRVVRYRLGHLEFGHLVFTGARPAVAAQLRLARLTVTSR